MYPRAKSLAKFKNTVRAKTRRKDGRCLPAIIAALNRTLRDWFGTYQHSHWTVFSSLDGWIRRRLRRMLLKRRRKRGSGKVVS